MRTVEIIRMLAVAAVALYGLHRAAGWAEGRGWIHYRRGRGRGAALGNALLEVHALVEPSKRHVIEERRRECVDQEDSGDPPEPRS